MRDINYREYLDDHTLGPRSDTNPHNYEFIIEVGHGGVSNGSMGFRSDHGEDFFRDSADNRREFFRNWSPEAAKDRLDCLEEVHTIDTDDLNELHPDPDSKKKKKEEDRDS